MLSDELRISRLSWKVLVLGTVLVVCRVGSSALAQEAGFSEVGKNALEMYQAGDRAGAIDRLESLRKAATASQVELGLLGTLYVEDGKAAEALEVLEPLVAAEEADPAALYNAGRAALALGRGGDAVTYLERSVARMPVSPAARVLGMLRGAQGLNAEAYRLLRPWVAQNPGDVEAKIVAILAALNTGRAEEAKPWLAGLPAEDPRVLLLNGQYLSATGDPQGAIEVLESILETHPPEMRADFYRLLAMNYIEVGRSRDAVQLLGGQLDQTPLARDPRLALILANAYHDVGELDAAVDALAPFAAASDGAQAPAGPFGFQIARDFGRYLVAAGRAEEAVTYLETATRMNPDDEVAWKVLADAFSWLGRREEARQALEQSTGAAERKIERERAEQIAALGPSGKSIDAARTAFSKKDPERALAILREEMARSPGELSVRMLEIRLLLVLQRIEEAARSTEAAQELFPGHPEVLYFQGVVQIALQNPQAAEKSLRLVLEANPAHTAAMSDLAVILMTQGKKDEARALLERVLELRPDDPMALRNLERMKP